MAHLGTIKKDEDVVSMVNDTKWPRLHNVAGWEDIQEDYLGCMDTRFQRNRMFHGIQFIFKLLKREYVFAYMYST